ncbi:sensor histidine kinase [Micromonospora sp. MA102]|uniref:sensor histidine kinase n=1 Tax=Micromonospora sp. MA102 TaxID=2952755 RepID=UPI0021C966B6|nr:sensor histidine kinase [Micromonospora sp. MA102]
MSHSDLRDAPTVALPLAGKAALLLRGLGPVAWQRVDTVVAVALLVGLTGPQLLGARPGDDPPLAILALGAGASLPLAFRRQRPVPVLAITVACAVTASLLGIGYTPFGSNAGPAVGLAMYTVADRMSRRVSLGALAGVVAATFCSAWVATWLHGGQENAVHVVAAAVGWLVGDTVRTRRAFRTEMAVWQRRELAERTRLAIAEERVRVSREVHDVISHNLSVIAVRSGIGRLLFDTRPDEARTALAEIETVSRKALGEVRRLLGAVRGEGHTAPAPTLADLPALVAEVTSSGVEVTLERAELPPVLPSALELTVYRIVQEALTNVVKHAGRTRARVVVSYADEVLLVEVSDDGSRDGEGRQAGEPGWGLVGIRERAALFGGTAETGLRRDGGFQVSVRFPVSVEPERGADR